MGIAGRCMGYVFWIRDRSANRILRGNPCLGQGIIAGVEEFPMLVLLHLPENTFMRRESTILSEELLLLFCQHADVDLLTLSREHVG